MFIDKDSIQVKIPSMQNYLSLGQYLVEVKYGYHKLWDNKSGRNLAGSWVGTLVGIFPKLTLQFRKLTKTEFELLAPILDSESQSFKYYDPNKKATVTLTTYTNDYEVVNKYIINGDRKNEPFKVAFISTKRRT